LQFAIKFGNFEFIIAIKDTNLGKLGDELQSNVVQNWRQLLHLPLAKAIRKSNSHGLANLGCTHFKFCTFIDK